MKAACSLLIAMITMFAVSAQALEPEREGQDDSLIRAIFAEGKLWLLSDAGLLSTIVDGDDSAARVSVPEPVLDICAHDGHPVAITGQRKAPRAFVLRSWTSGDWTTQAAIPTRGDALIALDCEANRITILTSRRLIDVGAGETTVVRLSSQLPDAQVSSMLATPDVVYVGLNAGEWGGGLLRIDRRNGKIKRIERYAAGQLCAGPLNPLCDPVTALISAPWRPQCIVAAIGLIHFSVRGRLIEICGDQVRRLYFRPFDKNATEGSGAPTTQLLAAEEPFNTVPFFGLTHQENAILAAGIDGIYRISEDGDVQVLPLPNFMEFGEFSASFDLPHVALVLTSVNRRRSLSGAVPMMVAR